jgi:hypothetical protein
MLIFATSIGCLPLTAMAVQAFRIRWHSREAVITFFLARKVRRAIRLSTHTANGLAIDTEKSEGSLLSALRSSFDVCHAAECRGRGRRVGHATGSSERLESPQKVFANEVANVKRSTRENESPSE